MRRKARNIGKYTWQKGSAVAGYSDEDCAKIGDRGGRPFRLRAHCYRPERNSCNLVRLRNARSPANERSA